MLSLHALKNLLVGLFVFLVLAMLDFAWLQSLNAPEILIYLSLIPVLFLTYVVLVILNFVFKYD